MDKLIYSKLCERAQNKQLLCEKYAEMYSPKGDLRLIIAGESPPIGDSYFYIPDDLSRRHQGLPAKIFRALFDAQTKIDKEQCIHYLKMFQESNYLLTDVVPYPIDCLIPAKRAEVINNSIDSFRKRIESLKLSKSCVRIMILPSGTHKELQSRKFNKILDNFNELSFEIIKWSQTEEKLQSVVGKVKTVL